MINDGYNEEEIYARIVNDGGIETEIRIALFDFTEQVKETAIFMEGCSLHGLPFDRDQFKDSIEKQATFINEIGQIMAGKYELALTSDNGTIRALARACRRWNEGR